MRRREMSQVEENILGMALGQEYVEKRRQAEVYRPQRYLVPIIDRAWELVQSVPYRVSARWLFYRLLQEGHYSGKADYKSKFLPWLSTVRKRSWKGWSPTTLEDSTREAVYRGHGYETEEEILRSAEVDIWRSFGHFHRQEAYVEVWFEAEAMRGQFEHYTRGVTLRPFRGDPSIPFKYQTAKDVQDAAEDYEKPVVVLYFGDLDPKGRKILEAAVADIRAWCAHPFKVRWCGLTAAHVKKYKVAENFEKPGEYQWEALEDSQAEEIITAALSQVLDLDLVDQAEADTKALKAKWLPRLRRAIAEELMKE